MWQTALLDGAVCGGRKAPAHGVLLSDSAESVNPLYPRRMSSMPKKQSTPPISTLASRVLSGDKKPTAADAKRLAASVLSQDEKRGQR